MANTGDGSWGHLKGTEHFGRRAVSTDYMLVEPKDLKLEQFRKCTQAGHCMVYSLYDEKIFGLYNPRAAILMQMRFDGYLGFPGGLIDEGEDVICGLNRELVEEVHFDVKKHPIKPEHHVISHWNAKEKLTLHFYAREVPMDVFKAIEKDSLHAEDYGTEVMGVIRVPLYTMGDGYRGFPAFLSNIFAGNSRQQLIQSLLKLNIMTQEEITQALQAKPV